MFPPSSWLRHRLCLVCLHRLCGEDTRLCLVCSTVFVAKTMILHCVSTVFAAKTVPLPCGPSAAAWIGCRAKALTRTTQQLNTACSRISLMVGSGSSIRGGGHACPAGPATGQLGLARPKTAPRTTALPSMPRTVGSGGSRGSGSCSSVTCVEIWAVCVCNSRVEWGGPLQKAVRKKTANPKHFTVRFDDHCSERFGPTH